MCAETFVPEHRPIVEFALDNIQTLRHRLDKLRSQQKDSLNDAQDFRPSENSNIVDFHSQEKSRKRKPRHDVTAFDTSKSDTEAGVGKEIIAETHEGRASKKQKHDLTSREANNTTNKKVKDSKKKPVNQQEESKPDGIEAHAAKGKTFSRNKSGQFEGYKQENKKRRLQDQVQGTKEHIALENRKKTKKNSDPLGRDVPDKLDMLIEQYRKKFAPRNSGQTDTGKQGSKQLKRWFQS